MGGWNPMFTKSIDMTQEELMRRAIALSEKSVKTAAGLLAPSLPVVA